MEGGGGGGRGGVASKHAKRLTRCWSFLQPLQDEEMEEEPLAGPQQPADKVLKAGGQTGGGNAVMDEQFIGEGVQEPGLEAGTEAAGEEGGREAAADSFVAALLQRQANLEEGATHEGTTPESGNAFGQNCEWKECLNDNLKYHIYYMHIQPEMELPQPQKCVFVTCFLR
jgi:hypothetical protein